MVKKHGFSLGTARLKAFGLPLLAAIIFVAPAARPAPASADSMSQDTIVLADVNMAPTTPTNITLSAISPTEIDLTWNPSTSATSTIAGYQVFRNGMQVATTTAASYQDMNLTPSTTYTYTVTAFDSSGNISNQSLAQFAQTPSSSNTGTSTSTPVSTTTPPTVPSNLMLFAVSPTEIDLAWSPSATTSASSTIAGYRVFRGGTQIATTTAVTYQDKSVMPSTTYTYTVTAFDNLGNVSAQTAPQTIATPSATSTGPSSTPPSVPTNVTASSTTSNAVTIMWSPSTSNTASSSQISYLIFRNNTKIATTTAGTTMYVDTNVMPGTTYQYTLEAMDQNGMISGMSSSVSVTVPSATPTPTTTPPSVSGTFAWLALPLSLYDQFIGASTTASSSVITYINGYPTINGNYIDCNGAIDNDPAHHTTDPSDTDPAHHSGQNCPANSFVGSGGLLMPPGNGNPNGTTLFPTPFSVVINGQVQQLVIVPIDLPTLQRLTNFLSGK